MAPSSSEFYPPVAHKRRALLERHLPPKMFTLGWLTKGMHRWNGTFLGWPTNAHKRYAPLEWHLPPLHFTRGWSQKVNGTFLLYILPSGSSQKSCTVGMAPSSCKFYTRVAHKSHAPLEWHLPPSKCTPEWLTKGMRKRHMHRWNGNFPSKFGSQQVPLEWHLPPLIFAHSVVLVLEQAPGKVLTQGPKQVPEQVPEQVPQPVLLTY